MAKRDDSEAPRRGRPKRSSNNAPPPPPPPPPPKSRMEMMLAVAAAADAPSGSTPSFYPTQPSSNFQPQQVYPSQMQQQQQPSQYHSYASQLQPPQMAEPQAKRSKRVKKNEEDWMPTPPVPMASSSTASGGGMSIGSLMAPSAPSPVSSVPSIDPVAAAASSSNMHSISSLTSGTPPPPPPEFKMSVSSAGSLSSILSSSSPAASAPSPTVSVFQAVPTIIQSFAETERRRNSNSASANGINTAATTGSNNMNISLLTHGNGKVTSTSTSTTASRGGKSDERSGRSAQLTMLDLFFPDANGKAGNSGATEINGTRDPTKSLKRKRRVDAPIPGSSSSRSSRRANEGEQSASTAEYDMLRFGVDSAKLIPQGLVDRVDAKMDRAFISRLIRSHVDNWIKRAGFGSSFLTEVSTLLTAYYPCHYPTILDEVLVCFLFKRPEFIDLLLKPMIEKLQKMGESATSARYPVVDAFARICYQATAGGASERSRHDFACEVLLQCLLEQNTEKFILSPAIAACAVNCSDIVLEKLWRQILSAWVVSETEEESKKSRSGIKLLMDDWNIVDPIQQAFELLEEERKTRLRVDHVGRGSCRMSSTLTRLVLLDVKFKTEATILSSSVMQQALEFFFGYGSTSESSALLLDRVRCLADNSDKEFAHLLKFLVNSTAKLSVKKTNWFSRHVLRFLLCDARAIAGRKKLLAEVVNRYMPLLLGASDKDEWQQNHKQASTKSAVASKSGEDSSVAISKSKKTSLLFEADDSCDQVSWDALEIVEKHSVAEIIEKIEIMLDMLEGAHPAHSTAFLEIWTTAWSSKANQTAVPWMYVHALVLVAVNERTAEKYRFVLKQFQSLVSQTCRKHFRQMRKQYSSGKHKAEIVNRFTDSLYLFLLSPSEFAQTLLREIIAAIRLLGRGHGAAASASSALRESPIFNNAVMACLGEGKRDEIWKTFSSRRSSPQKSAQETSTPAHSAPQTEVDLRVLVSLLDLASLEDETGKFVRAQLSSRQTVRLLTGLMREVSGNRYKMAKLIDLLDAVISQRQEDSSTLGREWFRQHIVQQLVTCAYSVGTLAVSDRLVGLLQSLAQNSVAKNADRGSASTSTLLWVTLRQCTRFCCGCSSENTLSSLRVPDQQLYVATAGSFAELVKVMLCTSSASSALWVSSVGEFVEQELSSCNAKGTRMNTFLLLLLQKMARVERQPRSCISAVQLAVFSIGATTRDQIRILQLQLLKALCSRLVGMRDHRVPSKSKAVKDMEEDCREWEELVCNERLRSDLKRIVNAGDIGSSSSSSSRTSIILAQGVLKFVAEVDRMKHVQAVSTR